MTAEDIHKIVKSLIRHEVLLFNHYQFFMSLNLGENVVHLFNRSEGMTNYKLFHNVISNWVYKNDGDVKVDTLCAILKEEGFGHSANSLRRDMNINRTNETLATVDGLSNQRDEGFRNSTDILEADLFRFETDDISTKNFVGRKEEMNKLAELFASPNKFVLSTIKGMGGVGKSELAKNFARLIFFKKENSCYWLNGDTSPDFQTSIHNLAQYLNIQKHESMNTIPQSIDGIIAYVIDALRLKSVARVLLIIDNVNKGNEDVKSFITKIQQIHSLVLVTSRNEAALAYPDLEEVIRLDVLPREMSTKLIRKSFPEESDENVDRLCHILQDFPLALQQAMTFITRKKKRSNTGITYTIQTCLENYERRPNKLLEFKFNVIDTKYKLTTLEIWDACFNQISTTQFSGKLATQLLNCLAYFQPELIPVKFLYEINRSVSSTVRFSKKQVDSAVKLIKEHSLIKVEPGMISIHRLIQDVTRINLISNNTEFQILNLILEAADYIYGKIYNINTNNFSRMELFEINNHVVSAMERAVENDELVRRYPNLSFKLLERIMYFNQKLNFMKLMERKMIAVLGENDGRTLLMGIQVGRALNYS